jgi:hypothetical protein
VRGGKFKDNSRAQKFRGERQKNRSAPAQGTLRALKKKNQSSREQFRAKSGVPVAVKCGVVVEQIKFAGFSGKVQATTIETGNEIGFCAPVFCAGTAGVFCELEEFLDAQQAMSQQVLPQFIAGLVPAGNACVGMNGVHTSNTLAIMANSFFTATNEISH